MRWPTMGQRPNLVATDRLFTILGLIAEREGHEPHAGMLCHVAAAVTALDGAAIALVSPGPQYTGLCTTDEIAAKLLDVELTLGEGPTIDACSSDGVVEEASLHSPDPARWMAYASMAAAAGAHAVFAFPVRMGAVRIGALCLYRDASGDLTSAQFADGYLMASVVGRAVLAMQAGAAKGSLAATLESDSSFDFSVHQAAGMVAIQGAMSVGDALVALRSHAFSSASSLADLAQRVVARRTFVDPETREWRNNHVDDMG